MSKKPQVLLRTLDEGEIDTCIVCGQPAVVVKSEWKYNKDFIAIEADTGVTLCCDHAKSFIDLLEPNVEEEDEGPKLIR